MRPTELMELSRLTDLYPFLEPCLESRSRELISLSLFFTMTWFVTLMYGPCAALLFSMLFEIFIGSKPWLNPVLTGSLLVYFLVRISNGGAMYACASDQSLAWSFFCYSSSISFVILDLVGLLAGSLSFSMVKANPFLSANYRISSSSLRFCSSSLFYSASNRSCSESFSSSSSSAESSELLFEWSHPSASESSASSYSSSSYFYSFVGVMQSNPSNSSL